MGINSLLTLQNVTVLPACCWVVQCRHGRFAWSDTLPTLPPGPQNRHSISSSGRVETDNSQASHFRAPVYFRRISDYSSVPKYLHWIGRLAAWRLPQVALPQFGRLPMRAKSSSSLPCRKLCSVHAKRFMCGRKASVLVDVLLNRIVSRHCRLFHPFWC